MHRSAKFCGNQSNHCQCSIIFKLWLVVTGEGVTSILLAGAPCLRPCGRNTFIGSRPR